VVTHRLAVVTACATYVLLLVGGMVHGTGSGLACPDWPTCYGSFFPRMEGGVLFEHSHRLFASAVGLLTIALAVALARAGRWQIALVAVALVVFQGVLGGLTVLFQLPDLVSTGHLAVSMIFFALTLYVAFSTSNASIAQVSRGARNWLNVATWAVFGQIVLGALVRHTESGLACSGWALCHGSLWPVDAHPATRLHMLHRISGVLVALLIFVTAWALRRTHPRLARALPALVILQIALGLASVRTGLSLWAVQAHLAVAAALWGVCVWAMLSSRWRATEVVPGAAGMGPRRYVVPRRGEAGA
jgi:heme A synthase